MYFIAEEEKKRLIEYFFRGWANLSLAVPKICDTSTLAVFILKKI